MDKQNSVEPAAGDERRGCRECDEIERHQWYCSFDTGENEGVRIPEGYGSPVLPSEREVAVEGVTTETCLWQMDAWDETEEWRTACGESWCFIEGGPTDNRMRYCSYCSKLLQQRINMRSEDDDE